ncbi:hypothetical protein [Metabacillus malikii]|uniref:Uncharacterized protein n=1 Tax=Metabacillus malikii TaxID=1504265 RepID=A0ABT9ZJ34_9BACI|nr:hypothetical protein [Metabacillus malikii]MDQ0232005.1 hypothetical protein [Metabacillus malikii]
MRKKTNKQHNKYPFIAGLGAGLIGVSATMDNTTLYDCLLVVGLGTILTSVLLSNWEKKKRV